MLATLAHAVLHIKCFKNKPLLSVCYIFAIFAISSSKSRLSSHTKKWHTKYFGISSEIDTAQIFRFVGRGTF